MQAERQSLLKERRWSCSVVSDSLRPHGLWPTRFLRPWDFPGTSTGVGCHFLLQEIFPSQGLNPGLPHCRQTLYRLSHQGGKKKKKNLLRRCQKDMHEIKRCNKNEEFLWWAVNKLDMTRKNKQAWRKIETQAKIRKNEKKKRIFKNCRTKITYT